MTAEVSQTLSRDPVPALKDLAEFRFLLRTFLSFSEIASEREGIQTQQYQLMQVIAALPEGEQASISYIADRMVLRHNSTVELVDRAEKAGLVSRRNDPKDLRRSLVVLTPQGEEILQRLVVQHIAELRRVGDDLIRAIQAVQRAETQ